jgi:protein-S-isoprenylcysteine O-methyltransferase Ste14
VRGGVPETAPRYWFPKAYADFVQRLRVLCGFILLLTFGGLSRPSLHSMALGLTVALPGLLVRGWAAGHLRKDQTLTTSGPYAYVRNPLYLGTLIVAGGIVIAARSGALALIFAAVFLLVYLPAIELEEQHLRDIFRGYAAYAGRVRRFVPLARWKQVDGRFSWALYKRNQEYKALLGFIIAVAWLIWKTGSL